MDEPRLDRGQQKKNDATQVTSPYRTTSASSRNMNERDKASLATGDMPRTQSGGIAQLVERQLCKLEVTGSNPVASTNATGRVAQLVRARP
jgi:hypothetical protein